MTIAKKGTFSRYEDILSSYLDETSLDTELMFAAREAVQNGECSEVGAIKALDDVLGSAKNRLGQRVAGQINPKFEFPL